MVRGLIEAQNMVVKDIRHYLKLPYTFVLRTDDEGDVVARVDELPGCATHGKDTSEALDNLREAMEAWIAERIESGQPVPEPSPEDALPSGKWLQRVPRSLHKRLSQWARTERVSLNQLVTSILAEAVGSRVFDSQQTSDSPEDVWAPVRFFGSARGEATWHLPNITLGSLTRSRSACATYLNFLGQKQARAPKSRVAEMASHIHEE